MIFDKTNRIYLTYGTLCKQCRAAVIYSKTWNQHSAKCWKLKPQNQTYWNIDVQNSNIKWCERIKIQMYCAGLWQVKATIPACNPPSNLDLVMQLRLLSILEGKGWNLELCKRSLLIQLGLPSLLCPSWGGCFGEEQERRGREWIFTNFQAGTTCGAFSQRIRPRNIFS